MKSESEPASAAATDFEPRPIAEIGAKLGVNPEQLVPYGRYQAKLDIDSGAEAQGRPKLILVSAVTATNKGIGKTVTSIGLGQAFGRLGLRHCVCLRQPSLGPTLGMKGGAAGGGRAQLYPAEDINLHFTGDFHAVTSAHNLLAALLDNHVHFGNPRAVDTARALWPRVLDLCDRQLRNCRVGLGSSRDGFEHEAHFEITAASEVMAVLALARNLPDLERRLARMVVAVDRAGTPITADAFGAVGAMTALLRDALRPNLVQTLEHTPALIHAGPFANIAHGASSVIATRTALAHADYVITEAGFSTELGAEKFMHIKAPQANVAPAAAVLVVTCAALRRHGGASEERIGQPDLGALNEGLANLSAHVENLSAFALPVVVALNSSPGDSQQELERVRAHCDELGVAFALSEAYSRGGEGAMELALAVKRAADTAATSSLGAVPRALYRADEPFVDKLRSIARTLYRADDVEFDAAALRDLEQLERHGYHELPPCVAKTQYSLSDQKDRIGVPRGFRLRVRSLRVAAGAGFIVVRTGNVVTMPGMSKHPGAERIQLDASGRIRGLF